MIFLLPFFFVHFKSARCTHGANASISPTSLPRLFTVTGRCTDTSISEPPRARYALSLQHPRQIIFHDRRCDRLTRNFSHRHKRLGSARPSRPRAPVDSTIIASPSPVMKRRAGRLQCFCRCGPHRSKLMIISLFLLSPAQLLACHAPLTRTSTQAQVSAVHSVHITLCCR